MEQPRVSIITVCFNAATTIVATLESVAAQVGVEIEHVIIDGNSTDGTQALVRANLHEHMVFVSEPDRGLYDAMNKGVSKASGDVIAFLNADDVYAKNNVVSQALDALTQHQVASVYGDLVFVDQLHGSKVKRVWTSQAHHPGLSFSGWMPAHPTLFMLRTDFLELGGFDLSLKYQADLEFCARAFEIQKISSRYVPEVWVRMRLGGVSTGAWSTRIKGNWESYRALRKLGLKRDPISFFLIKFGRKLPQLIKHRIFPALYPDTGKGESK